MIKFRLEQLALYPRDRLAAIALLRDMGLTDWVVDIVYAEGEVFGNKAANEAALSFNYQGQYYPGDVGKPLELEVLQYGPEDANWVSSMAPTVSHLGMHCTEEELAEWREFFQARGIRVAQEVCTVNHTNPAIAGKRWYRYVIFDTRSILGVDVKFIVRKDSPCSIAG